MYTEINYKSKKALKEAIKEGKKISVYSPGPFPGETQNGTVCVEGPWYPEPHKWYAQVTLKNGYIVKVA